MILGASFYGYIIATVTSLVSSVDANTEKYYEKMHMIHAYMRAQKFPRGEWVFTSSRCPTSIRTFANSCDQSIPTTTELQQKVHKYFKRFYEENTSLDAKAILNDLDPKLREEVGLCLIEQSLLKSYLFMPLAESSLCKLPVIFKLSIFETGRYVT